MHLTLRSNSSARRTPAWLTLAVEGPAEPGVFANAPDVRPPECLEQRTLIGHGGGPRLCLQSDGLRVVTGGADTTARVWDAASGRELFVLRDHEWPVVQVAYSPDGQRLLTIASSRTDTRTGTEEGKGIVQVRAHLWEATTGRLVATWQDPPAGAPDRRRFRFVGVSARFSPDGRRIVTTFAVHPHGAPQIRDSATGQLVFTLAGHTDPVTDVAYSADGKRIATASTDRTAILWDADSGRPVLTVRHPSGIGSVAFSPDGRRLLTVGNGITLSRVKGAADEMIGGHETKREDTAGRIWDTATGTEVAALKWPDNGRAVCSSGAFSPDGTRVVTTGDHYLGQFGPHGFPWVWDAATGKPLVAGRPRPRPGGRGRRRVQPGRRPVAADVDRPHRLPAGRGHRAHPGQVSRARRPRPGGRV